jgi:hypothetical protein
MSIEAMKQALEELKPFASTEVWDKLPASAKIAILSVEGALFKAIEQTEKREWVGLTNEEKEAATGWSVEHIEAKLKEKNS